VAQEKSPDKKPAARAKETPPKDTQTERTTSEEKYLISPDFWDALLDSIPPWGDEIAAIVLIVFGVVSFLSLLNVSSDATLANAWSNALTQLFGYGSVIVCAGILLLGVIILLPKLGIVIRFPTRRILAIEIAFLSSLAILHLLTGDREWRAVARAGQGGGWIGGTLSGLVSGFIGSSLTFITFGVIFAVCVAIIAGVNRKNLSAWLQRSSEHLHNWGEKHASTPKPEPIPTTKNTTEPAAAVPSVSVTDTQSKRVNVMRIRPDRDALPPSQRTTTITMPTATPPQPSNPVNIPSQPAAPKATPLSQPAASGSTIFESKPLPTTTELATAKQILAGEFNFIGTIIGKKAKGTQQMVQRPDGRVKRYFTVAEMQEPKRIGKRDKDVPPLTSFQDVELNPPDEEEINRNVVLIENTLLEFEIDVDVVDVKVGPTVTQYAVQPFRETTSGEGEISIQRTRLSKIASLSSDLALTLSAKRLRLEIPVPGHNYMGVEVPNKNPSIVALRSVIESRYYAEQEQKGSSPLYIPLGRDVSGSPVGVDIAGMPHLLIAGTTGSGKSVCIAAIATALVLNNTPDRVKLVMLDPKMVELSRFNGLPHLLGPVETDQERIIGVLRWCTREMDRRYKLLEEHAARNIEIFNSRLGRRRQDEYLPYIVIMVDEIGDLMLSRPEETEKTITRLAQMARATGMHLVVATQRPSVDVITGLIKANFPSRIAFAVPSGVDSRVILDSVGAETLLGRGDMLFLAADAAAPRRLQGCYVADDEVRAVVKWWKDWAAEQNKDRKPEIAPWERGLTRREFLSETDPMLEDAIELVIKEGEASASLIQRRLGLGYPRAARIMDLLEELGVIGEPVAGGRNRKVLIKPGKDPFKEIMERKNKGSKGQKGDGKK
jgi:S-DNA-T family DNA segregation ATPase FtsK/SpoIIIE